MVTTYDLKRVVLTIGGIPITGFGETDAISFEPDADIAEKKKTADGGTVISRLNDSDYTATLHLMQTSLAIPLLQGVLVAQHGAAGIAPPIMPPTPFVMVDPTTGDECTGLCVIMSRPAPSKAKTVGEITIKILIVAPQWTYGAANVVPG